MGNPCRRPQTREDRGEKNEVWEAGNKRQKTYAERKGTFSTSSAVFCSTFVTRLLPNF